MSSVHFGGFLGHKMSQKSVFSGCKFEKTKADAGNHSFSDEQCLDTVSTDRGNVCKVQNFMKIMFFLLDFHENLTIREGFATVHNLWKLLNSARSFFRGYFCLFGVHP